MIEDAWHNILYHFGPPVVTGLLIFWLGRKMSAIDQDRKRNVAETHQYHQDIKARIDTIRKQNGWFIRKFIELSTLHNVTHKDTKIEIDDYPNGYDHKSVSE